jgi:hypothetical protein
MEATLGEPDCVSLASFSGSVEALPRPARRPKPGFSHFECTARAALSSLSADQSLDRRSWSGRPPGLPLRVSANNRAIDQSSSPSQPGARCPQVLTSALLWAHDSSVATFARFISHVSNVHLGRPLLVNAIDYLIRPHRPPALGQRRPRSPAPDQCRSPEAVLPAQRQSPRPAQSLPRQPSMEASSCSCPLPNSDSTHHSTNLGKQRLRPSK